MSNRALHQALIAGALCVLVGAWVTASAAPWRSYAQGEAPTDRVIVRWRDTGVAAMQIASNEARAARLSQSSGIPLRAVREMRDRLDVVRLDAPLRGAAMRDVLARLNADLAVKYAEPDAARYALLYPDSGPPDDPHFIAGSDLDGQWLGQWYLKDPDSTALAATGTASQWPNYRGAPKLGLPYVIAVLDTGIDFNHQDLGHYGQGGKLLPGIDFVCNDSTTNCTSTAGGNNYSVANDGDGWDNDATDPGDWLTLDDIAKTGLCPGHGEGLKHDKAADSTWHGTRVAGIAAAITNNSKGVAGVAPDALILPVRVLGKCKGYMSDIVEGMYWAAGLTTSSASSLRPNAYPAQVLNLSLGGSGPCSKTEQDAVTTIIQDGHLIVAAAGNDGGPVLTPANCVGVLSVAGLRHVGTKVGYSNVSSTGAAISIAAPAGNCVNNLPEHPFVAPCLYSIETTSNDGKTTLLDPAITGLPSFYTYAKMVDGYQGNILNEGTAGTSFAAPIVAGVAVMMIQANPNMSANQLIARMQAGSVPFPVPATAPQGGVCHVATLTQDSGGIYNDLQTDECQCTTATCGAGMLNTPGAILQALYPLASLITSTDKAAVGDTVTLDGSASTASSGTIASYQWKSDPDVSIANATSAKASLIFPALRPITVTLTVTDSFGRQDIATKTINSVALSAGGGGGSMGTADLLLLAAGVLGGGFRRRRVVSPVMLCS